MARLYDRFQRDVQAARSAVARETASITAAKAHLDRLVASGADESAVRRAQVRLDERVRAARKASSRSVAKGTLAHAAKGSLCSLEGVRRSVTGALASSAASTEAPSQGNGEQEGEAGPSAKGPAGDAAAVAKNVASGALRTSHKAVTSARDRIVIRRAVRLREAVPSGKDAAGRMGRVARGRGVRPRALAAQRRVARRARGPVGMVGTSGAGTLARAATLARAVADAPLSMVHALLSPRTLLAAGGATAGAVVLLTLALPLFLVPVMGMATSSSPSGAPGGGARIAQVAQQEYDQGAAEATYHRDDPKYWDYVMGGGFSNGSSTPWCACFVSWCADEAGLVDSDLFPKSASVLAYRAWFSDPSKGTIIPIGEYTPMVGDLITYGTSHIGIVTKVADDGSFETIEGNTSGPAGGTQASGSHVNVKLHKRQADHSWSLCWSDDMRFIRPSYPFSQFRGSIVLPEGLGTFATREFDLSTSGVATGMSSPYAFPGGTVQRRVQDAWVAAGAVHDDRGFCTLNGCYLVACTDTYGQVGDQIDFYLSDGTVLRCIKVDAKSMTYQPYDHHPANEWGHNDGQNVIEFCGEDRIGDNPYTALGLSGVTVTSATNNGPAA